MRPPRLEQTRLFQIPISNSCSCFFGVLLSIFSFRYRRKEFKSHHPREPFPYLFRERNQLASCQMFLPLPFPTQYPYLDIPGGREPQGVESWATYLRGRLYHTDSWVILNNLDGEEKDLSEGLTVVLRRTLEGGGLSSFVVVEKVRVQFGGNCRCVLFRDSAPRMGGLAWETLNRFGWDALPQSCDSCSGVPRGEVFPDFRKECRNKRITSSHYNLLTFSIPSRDPTMTSRQSIRKIFSWARKSKAKEAKTKSFFFFFFDIGLIDLCIPFMSRIIIPWDIEYCMIGQWINY